MVFYFWKRRMNMAENKERTISDSFMMFENGMNISYTDEGYYKGKTHIDCHINGLDDTFEDGDYNEIEGNCFAETTNNDVVGACEWSIGVLDTVELDLKKKLETVKKWKQRLLKGMINGYVLLTEEENKEVKESAKQYKEAFDHEFQRWEDKLELNKDYVFKYHVKEDKDEQ